MVALTKLRADARVIFEAGVQSADPFVALKKVLQLEDERLRVGERIYDLAEIQNLFVVGCGKAAARMGLALESVLGARIRSGVVSVKYGHGIQLERIEVVEAGHPVPDVAGLNAARRIIDLARLCKKRDLLCLLISGGGSALLPYPADTLTLTDKIRTTSVLLRSGATIQEINAVRKHISGVKGGRLVHLAAPARSIALILSDVIGDSLEVIASGLTVPDCSTYGDCLHIIRDYDLDTRIPRSVVDFLKRGARGRIPETPKPSDPFFQNVQNIIIGNNAQAIAAAQKRAEAFGYRTLVRSEPIAGESRAAAKSHVAIVKEIGRRNKPASRPTCLVSGGETTVTVRGDGIGGRNQEFCLAAALEVDGLAGVVILSGGTDGSDGPTDAAGAIVDGSTIARGKAKNLDAADFLARNDSYSFFQATGDLLVTGPTLTNVMDLQITLIG
jgi:glycerate 2-kinase